MKNIPCVELPNKPLDALPKDGLYAMVSYRGKKPDDIALGMDIFEWWAEIHQINGDSVDWQGSSSCPATLLERHPVDLLILAGLKVERRGELESMLSKRGIQLTEGTLC